MPPKCTSLLCSKLVQRNHLHFFRNFKTVRCLRVKYSKFFRRAIVDISTCGGDFWNSYFLLIWQFHNSHIPWSSSVSIFEVHFAVFIRCTTAVTRSHALPFVVTGCITRCHSLYHSLYHSLSLVVSLVVIRCHPMYHSSVFL